MKRSEYREYRDHRRCHKGPPNEGLHNRDILTNRLTAVIDMSLPVVAVVNRLPLVTVVAGSQ